VGSELAGDRDRDDRAWLASLLEVLPAAVEAVGAVVGLETDERGLAGAAPLERCAWSWRASLVPGRLDQQPACVAVAGLRDRSLAAARAA